ncbi:MAG: hypothetical protein V7784_19565 [Oceanospirillaceae bacterium]
MTSLILVFSLSIGSFSGLTPALEVSPLVHEISSSGRGASGRLLIRNSSDSEVPLEMEVQRIDFSKDGKYTLTTVEEDILVFPPAVLLRPGASQVVRLQWVGEPELAISRSYFIKLSQPAVSLPQQPQNGVRLMLTFNILVHVASPGSQASLQVESVEQIKNKTGTVIQASIRNEGQRYSYISDAKLIITVGDKFLLVMQPGVLRERGEDVFLPPDSRRTVLIPVQGEGNIWNGPIKLTLSAGDAAGF